MQVRTIRMIIENEGVLTAPAKTTVSEAAGLMKQRQVGAILVVDDGRLAGVFTERDALYRVIAGGLDARMTLLADVMTRNPETIHPDRPFVEALHLMHQRGFRHVPVVENGQPIGMVTARDALGPELEDFVYAMLHQDQVAEVLA